MTNKKVSTSKTTFIYSLSDKNGYVKYIGKSSYINRRLKEHICESKKKINTYKNNWVLSLLKNGNMPIIEIIDEVPELEWPFWEIFYVSLFKSWGFILTNKTIGGNGCGHGIFNPNYGRKLTEEHKKKCSLKLSGDKNPFFGKTHPLEIMEKFYKKVLQYSINGNFIKEWESIKKAGDDLNIYSISSCCHNNLLSAGGFIWRFKENDNYPIKIIVDKTYRKPVLQFTTDNVFVKKWNSVKEAEKEIGCFHISNVCNNVDHFKTSGGFIWRFEH